ncbi:retrovirus-related pol polyprotein from transposon TNT 1-94 [Tanacetum coccineum]
MEQISAAFLNEDRSAIIQNKLPPKLDHLIRRIHQLDTTYQTFCSRQRIEFYSLNGVYCMTRSSTKELLSPFENPEQKFCSRRRLFDTPSLVESNSPKFEYNFVIEEQSEEEVREIMTETMEQYMSKTREDYGSGVTRPSINQDTHFELKGQFLKELRDNTFSGSEHEDANEHIEKGAIPSKTAIDAKIAIQEMAKYSQKWHNGTSSRTRSTETSDELAAIQAQHNNLEQEIKKVNEKVYAAQVECELCKGPHYIKDCPQKEEGETLEEAYYTQFAKRHEENLNIIKEIRASTDAAIRNQGASIKTLCGLYVVSSTQNNSLFSKTVPFLRRLQNFGCDDWRETQDVKILDVYDHTLPQKEKDPGSFTLPCFLIRVFYEIYGSDIESGRFKLGTRKLDHNQRDSELLTTDSNKKPGASIKNLEIKSYQMRKVLPGKRVWKSCPASTEINPQDQVKSISTGKADFFEIRRIGCGPHTDKDEGKSHAGTLIDIPVFVGRFSIISGFTIIDDDDMTKDVVLGMKFCKKYASCQMIMKKFALGDKCEQIMEDE